MEIAILGIGIATIVAIWYESKGIRTRSATLVKVEKIIGQVVSVMLLINGLNFIDFEIADRIIEVLELVQGGLPEAWAAVASLVSFGIAIYRIIFKNAVDAGVAAIVKAKRAAIGSSSAKQGSIIDYTKGL